MEGTVVATAMPSIVAQLGQGTGKGIPGKDEPVAERFNAKGVPSGDGLAYPVNFQTPLRMAVLRLKATRIESSLPPWNASKVTHMVSFAARL